MKNINILFYIFLFILIGACKPISKKIVVANTEGYTKLISAESDVGFDLDENEIDPIDERFIVLTIKNNSIAELRNLYLEIQPEQSFLKFKAAADGTRKSPGYEGTCGLVLYPNETCTFTLSFTPVKRGNLNLAVTVNYTNLIVPDSATYYFTALVGTPAEMVIKSGVTSYNLGNVEQTDTRLRFLEIEYENIGELTARSITPSILNLEGDPVYSVYKDQCSPTLKGGKSCKITVAYAPTNNGPDDLPKLFLGTLIVDYWKNPKGEPAKVVANFTLNSFRLEADFTPAGVVNLSFSSLTVGNYSDKTLDVTNVGYRQGRLMRLELTSTNFSGVVSCEKNGSNVELVCSPTQPLDKFPYKIYDDNNCFGKDIRGTEAVRSPESCTFRIRYWPSVTLTENKTYPAVQIELVYDSYWKEIWGETFKKIIIARLNQTSSFAAAKLEVVSALITPPNFPQKPAIIPVLEAGGAHVFNFGDMPILASSTTNSTFYKITVNLKNTGGSPLKISEIYDGTSNGLKLILSPKSGTYAFRYYHALDHSGCAQIGADQTCTFSYNITPKDLGSNSLNYQNAFDYVDSIMANSYKAFNLKYTNGTSYNDDGTVINPTIHVLKNKYNLSPQGFLQITSGTLTQAITMGAVVNNTITVKNIGNGPLLIRKQDNLAYAIPLDDPLVTGNTIIGSTAKNTTSMRFLDYGTGGCNFYEGADKRLEAGESCLIRLQHKFPIEYRQTGATYNYPYRLGVETQFPYPEAQQSLAKDIYFTYLPSPDNNPSLKENTNTIKYTTHSQSEAQVVPQSVEPLTSAIIYRSAYTTNAISNEGYPLTTTSFAAQTVKETYWDYQGFAHHFIDNTTVSDTVYPIRNDINNNADRAKPATSSTAYGTEYMSYYNKLHKARESMIHLKNRLIRNEINPLDDVAANNPEDDGHFGRYIIHGGTTPTNVPLPISIKFHNFGYKAATISSVTADTQANSKFTMVNNIGSSIANEANSGILKVTFNSTVPGIYNRCFNIKFNSGLRSVRYTRVCVYAEAVAINYTQTTTDYNLRPLIILSEEQTGFTNITSQIGTTDDSKYTSFSVIKDSLVTITRRFKIKNNTNQAINKISVVMMTSKTGSYQTFTDKETPTDSIIIRRSGFTKTNSSNPYCTDNLTLLAGQECEIEIKYDPTGKGLEEYNYYLGAVYELQTNQYVYQTASVRFKNSEPAGLAIYNTTFSTTLFLTSKDVGYYNPITKAKTTISNSFPISINSNPVNKEGTAYYLGSSDAFNTFTTRVENPTELRASFLGQWIKYKTNYTGTDAAFNTYYNNLNESAFSDFPATDFIEIYKDNFNSIRIEANRYCFFGDEEGANTLDPSDPLYIPLKYQGFNRFSQNICRMKLHFSGYRTFAGTNCVDQRMGLEIVDTCNPYVYKLSYITANNTVGIVADIPMHMSGFMKPNMSQASSQKLTNIEVSSAGIARVELPDITPADDNRGEFIGGLLCYDKNYENLISNSLFQLLSDFSVSDDNATRTSNNISVEDCVYFSKYDEALDIGGLIPGNYYFFKPFAIRKFVSGKPNENALYYSSNVDMTVSTAFVPTESQIYSYQNGWLIDKYLRPEIGIRSLALSTCSAQKQTLKLMGIDKQISKQLINTSVFNYITADPDHSAGYPPEGVGAVTHWLSDSAYDIASSISLYDGRVVPGFPNFNLNVLDGMSEPNKAVYHLTCNNSPDCQLLYKLVGGDPGEGIFYEGVFYTAADAVNATIRCYSELLCPTNPNISINSINCIAP